MLNAPVRFKRVAAAFHDVTRVRSCDSSGSEHSADLSALVNSFIEGEIRERRRIEEAEQDLELDEISGSGESERNSPDLELQDSLKNCFYIGNDDVKRSLHAEVEKALVELGGINKASSSTDFKRLLMARLRVRSFDAGLCKSKWEKQRRSPSGVYEYIDIINAGGTRYIIEISLAGEFAIARPTDRYASLLETFPPIFVGKPDELKQVTKLMSRAIKKSMNSMNLHVSPWRRLAYMQAKWFGSYKRTTNEFPLKREPEIDAEKGWKRSVGFVPMRGVSLNCREVIAGKGCGRVGNLAAALEQEESMVL